MMATVTSGYDLEELYSLTGKESLEIIDCLELIEEIMPKTFEDWPEAILEVRRAIQYCLDSDAEFIGCGTTRICFADGLYRVVKIPYTKLGILSSEREIKHYESFLSLPADGEFNPEEEWIPTAECRYLNLGFRHIPLLTMERLFEFPKFDDENLPSWVQWVDCGQVGFNSKGVLVAYDL